MTYIPVEIRNTKLTVHAYFCFAIGLSKHIEFVYIDCGDTNCLNQFSLLNRHFLKCNPWKSLNLLKYSCKHETQ